MAEEYKIIYQGGEGEIIEKKSRFIASCIPVKSEEEALGLIEAVRKKYWDARHHCYAYVLGERNELMRCSDDGEPQGTAGKPMLDVLLGAGVHDALVIVTRYFGGVLLGTGGLVRAYSGAARAGLSSSVIITKKYGVKLEIRTDYAGLGKIQYILGQRGIHILKSEYSDAVLLEVIFEKELKGEIFAEITEKTNGQAELNELGECRFAKIDGVTAELE